jgi:hypothetical protein
MTRRVQPLYPDWLKRLSQWVNLEKHQKYFYSDESLLYSGRRSEVAARLMETTPFISIESEAWSQYEWVCKVEECQEASLGNKANAVQEHWILSLQPASGVKTSQPVFCTRRRLDYGS